MLASRFLVVGCGSIGQRHIANLFALGAQHLLACDTQESRRLQIESRFHLPTSASLEEAWSWKPTTVLVTTPTASHLPLALQAARHDCHLFIEKPLAHQLHNTDRLIQEIQQRKLISLVGCNLRFHPGLVKIKQLLQDNAIGQVFSARVEFGFYLPDWHPHEDYRLNYSAQQHLGGGVILDAIHEIDYIHWLLGEITAVHASVAKLSHLEIDTEDTAAIVLRFSSGALGEIHLDYLQRAYRRTCQIIGETGTILWDYAAGTVHCYQTTQKCWQQILKIDNWDPNAMYMDELKHFLDCLARKATPTLDAAQAQRVLQIALAAKQSSRSQHTVQLPTTAST